jgi:hypothetical protein
MNVSNYPKRLQVAIDLRPTAEPRHALPASIRQPSPAAGSYAPMRSFAGRSEKTVL